jgi:alpha-amylase
MYKGINPDKYVIGEQFAHPDRPEYQVAGEGLDMSFDHFIRIALENSLLVEEAEAFYEEWERILEQYPSGQFGTFLSNHDLDRFMSVIEKRYPDEELAFRVAKACSALQLTLPGVPYLYYGEELGQRGQGKDDNKRRAMQWDNTPGNHGFTDAPRPYGAGFNQGKTERNVENQSPDPESLLSHYRNYIALRNSRPSLQLGETFLLPASDPALFACLRVYEGEATLVVQNLSSRTVGSPAVGFWSGPFAEGLQASDLMGKRNIEAPEPTALGGLGKYQPVDRLDAFETLVIDLK